MHHLRSKRKRDEEAGHDERQKRKMKQSDSTASSSTPTTVSKKDEYKSEANWNKQDQFRLIESVRRHCLLMCTWDLDKLTWEVISLSVNIGGKGKSVTSDQCKEKTWNIKKDWTACFKRIAKCADGTGWIDDTTKRFNGPIEKLRMFFKPEDKKKIRMLLD